MYHHTDFECHRGDVDKEMHLPNCKRQNNDMAIIILENSLDCSGKEGNK